MKQEHMTNQWDVPMQKTNLQIREHVYQSSRAYKFYTSAVYRSISKDYSHTRRFNYNDAIMSPLLRSEKPSVEIATNPQGYLLHAGAVLKHYTPDKNKATSGQYRIIL
jgi:hypothetical protein